MTGSCTSNCRSLKKLAGLPPIHKSHPQSTSPEKIERFVELALQLPAYGCNKCEALLALKKQNISARLSQQRAESRLKTAEGLIKLGSEFRRFDGHF